MEQLNRAKLFHNFVIEKAEVTLSPRTLLFGALFDVVLEHHGAIICLLESGQHCGSAFALLRLLIETSQRALWSLYCAEEQCLLAITNNERQFPKFTDCEKALKKYFAKQQHPRLFKNTQLFVSQLHGLTHTGTEALRFRFDITEGLKIKPNYPDEAICNVLQQATSYLAMTAIATKHIVDETDDMPSRNRNCFSSKYVELFGPQS